MDPYATDTWRQLDAAVLAGPFDDALRLACADYLDEAGDPDRAAFVRAAVELDGLVSHAFDPAAAALDAALDAAPGDPFVARGARFRPGAGDAIGRLHAVGTPVNLHRWGADATRDTFGKLTDGYRGPALHVGYNRGWVSRLSVPLALAARLDPAALAAFPLDWVRFGDPPLYHAPGRARTWEPDQEYDDAPAPGSAALEVVVRYLRPPVDLPGGRRGYRTEVQARQALDCALTRHVRGTHDGSWADPEAALADGELLDLVCLGGHPVAAWELGGRLARRPPRDEPVAVTTTRFAVPVSVVVTPLADDDVDFYGVYLWAGAGDDPAAVVVHHAAVYPERRWAFPLVLAEAGAALRRGPTAAP